MCILKLLQLAIRTVIFFHQTSFSLIRFKFVCFRSKCVTIYTPDTPVQEVLCDVKYARFCVNVDHIDTIDES